MPVPSRLFFDLSAAAELSRSLRRGRPASAHDHPPVPTVEPPAAPAPKPLSERQGLPPFQRPRVQYAEELWHALLSWIREGLDALGVFALDKHGFSIANVGEVTFVPPEVLMASFTSVAQLLEAYLPGDRPLSELVISSEQEPPVTVLTLPWEGERVFIGLHGGRTLVGEDIEVLRATIREELARFSSEKADT